MSAYEITLLSGGLFRATWQGGVAVLLAWAVCRLFARMPASGRCWVWRLALLKFPVALLIPALVTIRLLAPPTPAAPVPVLAAASTADLAAATPHAPPADFAAAAAPTPALLPEAHTNAVAFALAALPRFVVALWMLGVLLLTARVIAAGWRTHRWRHRDCAPLGDADLFADAAAIGARLGLRGAPALYTAADLSLPLLIGLRRPTIVLPSREWLAEFSPASVRLMLAHELAHLHRRDLAWSWLPTTTRVLFFFCPPVWLAVREEAAAREAACDALAIQACEARAAEFGHLLLQIAARGAPAHQPRPAALALGVGGAPAEIKRRLVALRDQTAPTREQLRLLGAVLIVGAACALLPWRVAAQAEPAQHHVETAAGYDDNAGHRVAVGPMGEARKASIPQIVVAAAVHRQMIHALAEPDMNDEPLALVASGSGTITATPMLTQHYDQHPIDLTGFHSGGTLYINITLGRGDCAGSFDLYPHGMPIPTKGSAIGKTLAGSYDIPSGTTTVLRYHFTRPCVVVFCADGNWFSKAGSRNTYSFKAFVVRGSHPIASGSGSVTATPINTQNYDRHRIDLTGFPSGGTLIIDVTLAHGDCAGSFDLFPAGTPIPTQGRPTGKTVAGSYDVPPGATTSVRYHFEQPGVYFFCADGNWFSRPGARNTYTFTAYVEREPPPNP